MTRVTLLRPTLRLLGAGLRQSRPYSQALSYPSLRGKVVAVSGAGSGIGLETAKYLATLGVKLSITDIRSDAIEAAAEKIRLASSSADGDVLPIVTDVRSSQQVDQWIEKTVSQFGRLDGAVNLAGVVGQHVGEHAVTQLSDEEWKFVTDINLTGVFYAMRAQLRAMEKLGNGGSIINAASTAGLVGNPRHATYSAAKHGVIGLSRSAAKEVGSQRIRVNAIAPGVIDTPMVQTLPKEMVEGLDGLFKSGRQALGRLAAPVEIARTCAFLLSDDSSFITGSVLTVDGGEVC